MRRDARVALAAVVLSCAGLMQCGAGGLRRMVAAGRSDVLPAAIVEPAPNAQPAANAEPGARPKMDLVFALDTTASMTGLIAGAKAKIWEIARRAQEGKPAPELRVGLVAYRDVGDEYVTRVLELTGDLDKVYATLSDFTAAGGGDTPEHVLKGLHDAIEKMPWSDDARAVKLVYLVGDAPPHLDYKDGITLDGVLGAAARKGIRISAIRCGGDAQALAAFTDIARRTDGEVASIAQAGGVVAVATPYDADLAKLNAELAATELRYGTAAERADADKVVADNLAAPAPAQAERAAFYGARAAGDVRGATKKDLVAAPSALATTPEAELPEAMQKMSPAERAHFVEERQKKREAILAEVRAIAAAREDYLRKSAAAAAAAAPSAAPAPPAFDGKVMAAMKKAAAAKGIAY